MDGSTPERRPDDTDPAIFESVFVVGIQSAAQLERSDDEPDTAPKVVEKGEQEGVEVPPARIRGVPLAAGEETARVFLPNEGLVDSVPQTGQVLILTNQRLIAFRGVEGYRDTHMAMTSEIAQCSVRTGQRNWSAIMQGLMVVVGGASLYLIVGYWLAGRISGPNVPVLNIDVAPLVALVIVLAGVFILVSNLFTRPAGAVIFTAKVWKSPSRSAALWTCGRSTIWWIWHIRRGGGPSRKGSEATHSNRDLSVKADCREEVPGLQGLRNACRQAPHTYSDYGRPGISAQR